MFILTDKNTGGVYAVFNKEKVKTVQIFEEEDDCIRYNDMLIADGYDDELEILEVDLQVVASNCDMHGYFYSVITKNDFVIPPT